MNRMSFFEKLFGNGKPVTQPAIRFGRHTDCYRTPAQDEAFDFALQEFEKGQFLNAYLFFFKYLLNEEEQNVKVWEEASELRFEFFQGSKKITGFANDNKLYAESKVAHAKALHTSFMRRMLDENFELKYSRFSLSPENDIVIVFDTYTTDGSPYKLYGALKELATYADKHDDLLIDEFDVLEVSEMQIRRELPDWEKEVKYNYIVRQINDTFLEIDTGRLKADQYPVAMIYLLLHLCYKLDYLTRPEGYMMETLERIHRLAFAQDDKNGAQKILLLRKEFQKLLDRPKEKFFKEMYEVSATFGITVSVDHQKVALIIDQELPNVKWYKDNGHDRVALAIMGFIVGRCFFIFAVPPPDRDLFHLLMQVLESEYFSELGFSTFYKNGAFKEKEIKQAIRNIVHQHKKSYGRLNPELRKLVFSSLPAFAESFLWMMRELDLSRTD